MRLFRLTQNALIMAFISLVLVPVQSFSFKDLVGQQGQVVITLKHIDDIKTEICDFSNSEGPVSDTIIKCCKKIEKLNDPNKVAEFVSNFTKFGNQVVSNCEEAVEVAKQEAELVKPATEPVLPMRRHVRKHYFVLGIDVKESLLEDGAEASSSSSNQEIDQGNLEVQNDSIEVEISPRNTGEGHLLEPQNPIRQILQTKGRSQYSASSVIPAPKSSPMTAKTGPQILSGNV